MYDKIYRILVSQIVLDIKYSTITHTWKKLEFNSYTPEMVIFSKTLDNRAKKCTGARTSCSVVPKIGLIQRTNNCRQSELIRKKTFM